MIIVETLTSIHHKNQTKVPESRAKRVQKVERVATNHWIRVAVPIRRVGRGTSQTIYTTSIQNSFIKKTRNLL